MAETAKETVEAGVKSSAKSKTIWSIGVGLLVLALNQATKGKFDVDPLTQDLIADAIAAVFLLAAGYFKANSTEVNPPAAKAMPKVETPNA
jgi:hypothetical protein